jgi:hypothetical protein
VCRESVSDQASLPLARIRLLSDRSWLVTADEVPLADGRLDVEAVATVNGDALTRTWAGAQYFPWSDLVAHAARITRLRPDDVLGSGTLNRGCLLELGPLEGDRFLGAGDTVALEAAPVGVPEDRIAWPRRPRRAGPRDRVPTRRWPGPARPPPSTRPARRRCRWGSARRQRRARRPT